jgi:hypothetical protein
MYRIRPLKAKRKDAKFGPRAQQGVLIGYTFSQKQYKFYTPEEKRMTLATDVVFYEDSPFCNPKPEILLVPTSSDDTPEPATEPAMKGPSITEIHDASDGATVLTDLPSPIPTPTYPSLRLRRTLNMDSAAIQLQRESAQKDMDKRGKELVPRKSGIFPTSDWEGEALKKAPASQKEAPRAGGIYRATSATTGTIRSRVLLATEDALAEILRTWFWLDHPRSCRATFPGFPTMG